MLRLWHKMSSGYNVTCKRAPPPVSARVFLLTTFITYFFLWHFWPLDGWTKEKGKKNVVLEIAGDHVTHWETFCRYNWWERYMFDIDESGICSTTYHTHEHVDETIYNYRYVVLCVCVYHVWLQNTCIPHVWAHDGSSEECINVHCVAATESSTAHRIKPTLLGQQAWNRMMLSRFAIP